MQGLSSPEHDLSGIGRNNQNELNNNMFLTNEWYLHFSTLFNRNMDCNFIHHSNDIYKCRKYKFELEQFQDLFFFSQLSLSLLSFFSVLIFFLLATSDWAMAVERSFSWCC